MVDRPPVKFAGILPEGNLNGLARLLPDVLTNPEQPVWLLACATLRKTEHVVDTGLDWAVLRFVEIEVLPDGKISRQTSEYDGVHVHAATLLAELRSERIGDNPIPYDAADQAALSDLRATLTEWRDRQGWSDDELAADVIDRIPGAVDVAWKQDPRLLREYLLTVGAIDDEPVVSDETARKVLIATGHIDPDEQPGEAADLPDDDEPGGLVDDVPPSDGPLQSGDPDEAVVAAKLNDVTGDDPDGPDEPAAGVAPVSFIGGAR